MARRRRRWRIGKLSLGTTTLLLTSLVLALRESWPAFAVFLIFVLILWVAFFKQTQCDVETASGEGCGNPAQGRLRACRSGKAQESQERRLMGDLQVR